MNLNKIWNEWSGKVHCEILCVADTPGSVCIYFGAIIGLAIAWILLQFLILVGCYIVVRERYKKRRDDDSNSMQHKLQDDFNVFDNSRHVHWADEGNWGWCEIYWTGEGLQSKVN